MAYYSDRPAYQTSQYIWGVRFIQILFALIIVGIAGKNISDWHSIGCTSPPRLSFNFAIGFISLLLILYFILSTGPYIKLRWWNFFVQLGLDSLFIILWIVAAAVANYDCNSVCAVCSVPGAEADTEGYGFWVQIESITCACVFESDYDYQSKRRDAPASIFGRGGGRPISSGSGTSQGQKLSKTLEKGVSVAAKRGLDAAMILLFLISLGALVAMRFSSRKATSARVTDTAGEVEGHVDNSFKMEQPGAYINVNQVV